jgi:hypothetical protein
MFEQLELLADQRLFAFQPETGDIAAGPRQAGGQPDRRWVVGRDHHDRDRARRLVSLQRRCRRPGRDHGGLEGHQLVGERGQSRDLSIGEAEREGDVGITSCRQAPLSAQVSLRSMRGASRRGPRTRSLRFPYS